MKGFLGHRPGGAATATHFDPVENLMVVVAGAKVLRLFPPRCARNLEPANAPLFTVAGLPEPPFSKAFVDGRPGLAGDALDVEVNAGDVLYLPAGWWHSVRSVGPSLIVNFWADIHDDKRGDADAAAGARARAG